MREVIIIVGALLGTTWLTWWWRKDRQRDAANGWLYRHGYRLLDRSLYRITHEDDEGWWDGELIAVLRRPDPIDAQTIVIWRDEEARQWRETNGPDR